MNQGASAVSSDVLLFLHADTRLPDDAKRAIQNALADPSCIGGRFDVQFDRRSVWGSMISRLMNLRSRHSGIATGDQAIFVRTEVFRRLGGYEEIPVMEDIAFTRRLKRVGRLASLRAKVTTSYRRWERRGPVRTILLMWMLRLLYWFGVSPTRLARFYATVRE
jgi:rSAM/selenodomain-associated transferase 2